MDLNLDDSADKALQDGYEILLGEYTSGNDSLKLKLI